MKAVQATFYIKDEKREEFLQSIRPLIDSARKEEGCIKYHLYESIEEKNQFVMIENWLNDETIAQHNQNPLLKSLFGKMPEFAEKQTEIFVTDKEEN